MSHLQHRQGNDSNRRYLPPLSIACFGKKDNISLDGQNPQPPKICKQHLPSHHQLSLYNHSPASFPELSNLSPSPLALNCECLMSQKNMTCGFEYPCHI